MTLRSEKVLQQFVVYEERAPYVGIEKDNRMLLFVIGWQ